MAQSINSAVVGAVRGVYRAELNGIIKRDRYNISAAQKNRKMTPELNSQPARNSSQVQSKQYRVPTLSIVKPAKSNETTYNRISEKELNSKGFESF